MKMKEAGKRMKTGRAEKSDRTLDIPDDIIHRFLSLVDVRTAVQTCVLSRKWRNIWASLPFLKFIASEFTSFSSYRKFVDEFVSHRQDKSNITSIVIDLFDFDTPQLERVFQFVIDRKVEKLEIYNLVCSGALNFEFLKSLCLRGCNVSLRNFSCPALQTLHLDETVGYSYSDSDDSDSDEPILNFERFPQLENLTLELRESEENVEIRSNTLSQLSLLDMGIGRLRICTPNLSSFNFISTLLPAIIFPDGLPSLERAHIDVHPEEFEDFPHCFRELVIEQITDLLRAMSETAFITVSQATVNVLAAASNLSNYQPPCFRRLRSINLLRQLPTEDQKPSKSSDQLIRYLVNGSPDPNIFVQDRWMRIREYKPREHIFVSDDLGGYSVLSSMESSASEKHVQVQSYIEEREREVVKREAELSRREAEIARQEARLKMERENLEKEKTVFIRNASSLDNQDEAIGITVRGEKY